MDKRESLFILRQLADGIDPSTGEKLSAQSPFNHPQTVRALFHAITALEHWKDDQAIYAGQPWGKTEDTQLEEEFDSGMSIKDMARQHQRTVGAIGARLIRLGKVASKDEVRVLAAGQCS